MLVKTSKLSFSKRLSGAERSSPCYEQDRRAFLKRSGLTAAGLSVLGSLPLVFVRPRLALRLPREQVWLPARTSARIAQLDVP